MKQGNRAWRSAVVLALLACYVLVAPSPVSGININPYDYFDVDYCISLSNAEVEEGEEFSLEASAQVKCIKDLPVGANQAEVTGQFVARHKETGDTEVLRAAYDITISPVPDWKGDTYELTESIGLAFPEGSQPGDYEVVAELVLVSIDGWDVTDLVPESKKSVSLGTVTCVVAEDDEDVPETLPGYLTLNVLGNIYRFEIRDDGSLAEPLELSLVEDKVGLCLEEGAFCLDSDDEPLEYIYVVEEADPPACEDGFVVRAYEFRPRRARFDPGLEIALSYDVAELPQDDDEEELWIACYDSSAGAWVSLESEVDVAESIVTAEAEHFTTFAVMAEPPAESPPPPTPPTPPSPPAPASFVVSNLSITPGQVEPGQRVAISAELKNTGGTAGTYTLELLINGELQDSREIALAPQESQEVTYQVGRSGEGEYTVTLGGQTGKFTVVGASPADSANPGSSPESASDSSLLSRLLRDWLLIVIVVFLLLCV